MHRTLIVLLTAFALASCADVRDPIAPRAPAGEYASLSGPPPILADSLSVVYTNFGPGMSYEMHGGIWPIASIGGEYKLSQRFSAPPGDFAFARATFALVQHTGPGWNPLCLYLARLQADSSGRPGRVIEEMRTDGACGANGVPTSVSSALHPVLGDSLYWLTVAPGDTAIFGALMPNSIGDVAASNLVVTSMPGQAWWFVNGVPRAAFQIEGRSVLKHVGILHHASGGGTVLDYDGEKVTYAVTAQEMPDGSAKGELLVQRYDDRIQFKGTVTCLVVIDNRAFISGTLTKAAPPFDHPRFAIALEDNGEGKNATAPDRVSSLAFPGDQSPNCYNVSPGLDWTNGNAQVR